MSTAAGVNDASTSDAAPRRLRDLVAVNFGNTLEWYDWTIYTIFAPYFAGQFFNPKDQTSALLSSLAVFAVGFVTRPLGGYLFGAYADRVGRRKALTVAMMMTAVGSLLIAIAPTFATIGLAASVLLLIVRLLQGLAHGGEMGTSVTYLVERAPQHRRAFYGSTSWFSVVLGTMLATLTGLVVTSTVSAADMRAWGWRVAFGLGGLLGLYALYLRRSLTETDAFEETASTEAAGEGAPRDSLWRHWGAIGVVFGLSAGGSIMFYTWLIYMPTFAQVARKQSPGSALTASLIAQAVFLGMVLLAGWLGDRVGRRPLVVGFGVLFVALTIPLNKMVNGTFAGLLVAMLVSLACLALLFGVNGAVWAEVFPTRVRAAGVSGTLSLATALFGGTAPYINTALQKAGHHGWFLYYLMAVAGITLVTGLLMKETRHQRINR